MSCCKPSVVSLPADAGWGSSGVSSPSCSPRKSGAKRLLVPERRRSVFLGELLFHCSAPSSCSARSAAVFRGFSPTMSMELSSSVLPTRLPATDAGALH